MESQLLRFQRHPPLLPLPLSILPSFPKPLLLPPPSLHPPRGASFVVRADPQPPPAAEGVASRSSGDALPPPARKPVDGTGVGFGQGDGADSAKKKKGKSRERGSVVRRSPIQRISLVNSDSEDRNKPQEETVQESAFLLTWLGLGGLILVEGIGLSASGFLPEQWDNFSVKYIYPSFTPTVFLFIGGTVTYGVFKYLQAEKMKN